MPNTSIWPIDMTLPGATTLGQSGSGSHGNEGVLHISQSSSIIGDLPDCLVPYLGHSFAVGWEGSYPTAEMQSVYFAGPADWARV